MMSVIIPPVYGKTHLIPPLVHRDDGPNMQTSTVESQGGLPHARVRLLAYSLIAYLSPRL